MKQYELLKDLPDGSRKGDIYERAGSRYYNTRLYAEATAIVESHQWETWQVEDHPSWFRLIEDKPKEWEIIECKTWSGGVHGWHPEYCAEHHCKIHSVRRLSDGEVFTVGDRIGWEHGSDEISKIELDPKYKSGIKLIREKANYGRDGGIDISIVVKLESSIKKEFVWTDEMLVDWSNYTRRLQPGYETYEELRKFKQSKTQSISSDKERIVDSPEEMLRLCGVNVENFKRQDPNLAKCVIHAMEGWADFKHKLVEKK